MCLQEEVISRSGIMSCSEASSVAKFPEREIQQAMTSIHSPQQLGDAIRIARKQLALTQPQLALAAGVGVRFVVELEAGKPTVRLAQVLRVIDALGGEITLNGLPGVMAEAQRERSDHGT
jgi:HTH-type transcriptional regulator/antitoxin HipB